MDNSNSYLPNSKSQVKKSPNLARGNYAEVKPSINTPQEEDDYEIEDSSRKLPNLDMTVDLTPEKVITIEQALEACGGFGRFQKVSSAILILVMCLSQCFLYSFPFLEIEPKYICFSPGTNTWIHCSS